MDLLKYETKEDLRSGFKLNEDYVTMKASPEKYHIRSDCVDTGIFICAPSLFLELQTNADYLGADATFVNNTAANEACERRISFFEIECSSYFARVHSPNSYAAVTEDVIRRETYPMTIDSRALNPHSNFRVEGTRYIDNTVEYDISSTISDGCVISSKTKVGAGSKIVNSVIGKNCKLGRGCEIINSFIWDNAVLHDKCTVKDSILADGVVIGANCTLEKNMLSYKVEVKDDQTLQTDTYYAISKDEEEDVESDALHKGA